MADATYDAVIIGGGQHGLILGLYLRNAGMSTVVLERQHELGGAMCGEEIPVPGFLSNTCAHWTRYYSHPVYHDFNLRDYGLKLIFPEGGAGIIFDNGKCIVGYTAYPVVDEVTGRSEFSAKNAEKTLAEIAKFSERDAEVCRRFIEEWQQKWQQAFWEYYWNPPEPYGVKDAIERALDKPGLIEPVHQHMYMRQLAYDLFESDEMRVLLLRAMMGSVAQHFDAVIGIDQLLGALSLCVSLRAPSVVVGGTHAITHALQRAYVEIGGKFFIQNEVDKIIIENGKAKGVRLTDGTVIEAKKLVVSTVDVTQTILRFVGEEHVGHKIAHRAKNVWYGWGVLWSNLAVHEAPVYKAAEYNPDVLYCPRLYIATLDPEYLVKKYQAECYLRGFGQKICIWTGMDTLWDKARAPQGKHIIGVEQASAPASFFSEREWLQIKHDLIPHIVKQWSLYAPNMTLDNVIGYDTQTPLDIERRNINMIEGCTSAGKMITSQLGRFRPFPELSRYKTPIENLYLGGVCTHYGIGTARSNSYNCFKIIADDFGLEKIWEKKGRAY
jgi:phytoene dehydrogenase-like protein